MTTKTGQKILRKAEKSREGAHLSPRVSLSRAPYIFHAPQYASEKIDLRNGQEKRRISQRHQKFGFLSMLRAKSEMFVKGALVAFVEYLHIG